LNNFARDAAGTAEALTYYRGLSADALRVLAGLPGNDAAFTQITIAPLDPSDPAWFNRRGPDDPDSFQIGDPTTPLASPTLRVFIDTLDGRTTNRYFYRAAYVDVANNRSISSLATPPIQAPSVVPPRAPVIGKVLGGDGAITLTWPSNREPDLATYLIYRTDDASKAEDVRLMELVSTQMVEPGDPAARLAQLSWTDTPVPGLVTFYYRMVARDATGNMSSPSPLISCRAYDETPPAPPIWGRLEWVKLDEGGNEHPFITPVPPGETWSAAVALRWTTQTRSRTFLQRRSADQTSWRSASGWIQPTHFDPAQKLWLYVFYDTGADSSGPVWYRLKIESLSGNMNTSFDERELAAP